jgi:hypothetical protein
MSHNGDDEGNADAEVDTEWNVLFAATNEQDEVLLLVCLATYVRVYSTYLPSF